MGFFIRSTFWLSLTFAVLLFFTAPRSPEQESSTPYPAVSWDAITNLMSLCEREPHICKTATAMFSVVAAKVLESVQFIQDLERDTPEHQRPKIPVGNAVESAKSAR